MSQPKALQTAIVFGSWKLRYQEPLEPQDHIIYAVAADVAQIGAVTAVADLRGNQRLLARWNAKGIPARFVSDDLSCSNLSGTAIPLAVVSLHEENVYITHLLHRIDVHRSLFLQPPVPIEQPKRITDLASALRQAFELNHLAINNWECRYSTSERVFVESFELDSRCHARTLGEAWYDASSDPAMAPFTSQSGDEFQVWDHWVTPCRAGNDSYVWVEHWSRKRKRSIAENVVQLLRSRDGDQGGENREEVILSEPSIEAMALAVDSPLQALGEYRRYAFITHCESVETGNIFAVTFQTCSPMAVEMPAVTHGEIRFVKSRCAIEPAAIEKDLRELITRLHTFLTFRHMTWLPLTDRFAFLQFAHQSQAIQESLNS